MFANERQNSIYEMLQKDGAVNTSTLVEHFGVSLETIRRDLLHMEERKMLKRVHGGAVQFKEMKPFYSLKRRNQENSEQKRELSYTAAEFVSEGDYIGVDSGSTATIFAEVLKEKFSRLTIVTYSSDVFEILRDHADFSVILCGGHYLKEENAFCGPIAVATLNNLHMQKAFVCPTAISMRFGICDHQKDLLPLQQCMLRNADDVYILSDNSKFEGRAILKLDDMRSDYYYVTDSALGDELKKIYDENNIKIYF